MPAVVERAMKILNVELRGHGIETDINVRDDLPFIEANAVQLTQVLVNLLINAMHAMPEGGRISIRVDAVKKSAVADVKLPPSTAAEMIRVRVRDTGTGIPRENIGRIFDPFFTTKPVGQGSGLGLSVSHAIIRRHRGAMLVDSDGRSWTEFTILLPAAPPTMEPIAS
jgi:signal transduction histidine kinase